jgi:hypothetical protein
MFLGPVIDKKLTEATLGIFIIFFFFSAILACSEIIPAFPFVLYIEKQQAGEVFS